jgi:hypothetical protein
MIRIALFIAVLSTLGSGTFGVLQAHAAFNESGWQYMRSITVSGVGQTPVQTTQTGFAKVVLPADISKSAQGFADLRIVNQSGVETPYIVTRSAVQQGTVTTSKLGSMTAARGVTSFIADAGQNGLVHTGISLAISSPNFRRQVKLYASHWPIAIDSSEWSLVTDKAYIFKFTDPKTGFVSGKSDITFPPSSAEYFKVVIGAGDEGSVTVAGASLSGEMKVAVPASVHEIDTIVRENAQNHTTEIMLDLGSTGILTDAVILNVADSNYNRHVIVESSDMNTASSTWTYVGQSAVSDLSTSIFTGASNRVTYPDQKARFIRLSIMNGIDRPLSIENTASIESPVISSVFETKPGNTYRLYYGNPKAVAPTYDTTRISAYLQTGVASSAFLGDETDNPAYVRTTNTGAPFFTAHPYSIYILSGAVGVILLGSIGVYLYTRRRY